MVASRHLKECIDFVHSIHIKYWQPLVLLDLHSLINKNILVNHLVIQYNYYITNHNSYNLFIIEIEDKLSNTPI